MTFDLGLGPNIVVTDKFSEISLSEDISPDYIFTGSTRVSIAAMVGIGIEWSNFLGSHPLECGYRFMYVGPATLNATTPYVVNELSTGNNYVNALMCTVSIFRIKPGC